MSIPSKPGVAELLGLEAEMRADYRLTRRSRAWMVRDRLGLSMHRYLQLLFVAVENAPNACMEFDPVLTVRLREQLERRRAKRNRGASLPETRSIDRRQRSLDFGASASAPSGADGGVGDQADRALPSTVPQGPVPSVIPSPSVRPTPHPGEVAKRRGMAVADEAAGDAAWKARWDEVIERLARTGVPFTADDVRARAGAPEGHPNAAGARFQAAARAGLIVRVGSRRSDRTELHRHWISVWQGATVARAEGAA